MGFITVILGILGIVEQDAPIIERLLGGLGKFVSGLFSQLFGDKATAKLDEVISHAENLVQWADANAPAAVKFVKDEYGDLETLLNQVPGLAESLYAQHNIEQDHGLPRKVSAKIIEIAHANQRVAS